MGEYQRCNRCVMDNASDQTIEFDDQGYCNYCRDIEKRRPSEYFPNEIGKKKLDNTLRKIKEDCKNDVYDCIVGVSGGIDSSYIIYKGWQYGLRMLAVHIDDGLDNPIAVSNLEKLTNATQVHLINIQPDREEYADLIYSLLKASVSNLAIGQDNLILRFLQEYSDVNHINYILDGANFACESILERSEAVNPCDDKFIISIQKQFGRVPFRKLKFMTMAERYLFRHMGNKVKHIRPLDYTNYNLQDAIKELHDFCGFEYYGGKHYESILTRFMQCYYLPKKFGIDKRKSHYSSLIMSGQMSRGDALQEMQKPLYPTEDILTSDMELLADYMGISVEEMKRCIALPPKKMGDYLHSGLNDLAPLARKFRKFLK